MPNKDKNIPKRRFKAFENADAWELRKLGEISTHRGGTAIENHFSEDGKYKVISIGSYGLDNKYIDQKIRAVENEVTRSKVVNKNELTMVLNDKTANGNIIGRCLLIEADDEFVINQRTEIISFNSVIYPKFAYVVLNGAFREQVKKIVQGGTQIYVNYSSVEQLYLSLPTLAEQEAIGTFFSTLDSQITLHQRKLDKLKSVKQAYLSEMFPAEGERVPKRRFPGFTDDWELRKLGEYSTLITKGTTPRDKSGIGVVNFVKVENLVNGDIIPLQKIQLEEHEGYLKRSQLIENDILFSIAGTLGRTAIVKKSILPANTNQALSIIRGYEFDRNFLVTILRGVVVREFIKRNPTIGAQPNLSLEQVSNLCLLTPCSEEQSAIGTFFSTLDQHITLHQRKLEKLKNLKKALLNELFV
ncbi:TPA: restriction endonuclease subunit S [Streptococcus suis]